MNFAIVRRMATALGLLTFMSTANCLQAAILFGPTPYLSSADIPLGFYAGGPTALEDFEDASLDFGITVSGSSTFIVTPADPRVDSVDGDDGTIDGSGSDGHSLFVAGSTLTFSFPGLPTAAAIVWTDGNSGSTLPAGFLSLEAFGPGGSLGVFGPFPIGDLMDSGQTAEDRFLGVQDPGGITSIRWDYSNFGLEVDHIQYGSSPLAAIPEPGTWLVWSILGVCGLTYHYRRRRHAG